MHAYYCETHCNCTTRIQTTHITHTIARLKSDDPTITFNAKPINEPNKDAICKKRKNENVFLILFEIGYNVPSNIIINFELNNEYNVINAGN